MVGGVRLTNVGSGRCSLRGRPEVRLLSTGGDVLDVDIRRARPLGVEGRPRTRGFPVVVIEPKQRADVGLFWGNWCDGATFDDNRLVVRLELPREGGALTARARVSTPRCDAPGSASVLAVQPFTPAPRPEPPPPKHLPLRLTEMDLPESVERGTTLRYTITLRNRSKRPLRFRRCPVYRHGLDPRRVERRILNCAPVRSLGPGESATFAMVLQVPPTTEVGKAAVLWGMEPWPPEPAGKAIIAVTP